jgi:hypothetical protein
MLYPTLYREDMGAGVHAMLEGATGVTVVYG